MVAAGAALHIFWGAIHRLAVVAAGAALHAFWGAMHRLVVGAAGAKMQRKTRSAEACQSIGRERYSTRAQVRRTVCSCCSHAGSGTHM